MFNKDAIGRSKGYRPSGVLLRATKSMKGGERDRRAMEKDLILRLRRDGLDREQIAKIAGKSVATVAQVFKIADTWSEMEIEALRALIKKRGVTSIRAKISELCDGPKRPVRVKFDDASEAALGPEV